MSKSKDGQRLVKVWSRSAFGPFVVVGRLRLVVGGILVVGWLIGWLTIDWWWVDSDWWLVGWLVDLLDELAKRSPARDKRVR